MSEVSNNSEKMDDASIAEAAEEKHLETPVHTELELQEVGNLEAEKPTGELDGNKTHENVLETSESTYVDADVALAVQVAEEILGALENVEENQEEEMKSSLEEDLESETKNLLSISQLTAVEEHMDIDDTDDFEKGENIKSPEESQKDLYEVIAESTVDNQLNESEISATVLNIEELTSTEHVTENIKNIDAAIESGISCDEPDESHKSYDDSSSLSITKNIELGEAVEPENSKKSNDDNSSLTITKNVEPGEAVEPENSNKCYDDNSSLTVAKNLESEEAVDKVTLETAADNLNNETKTSNESDEIISLESAEEFIKPVVSEMSSTEIISLESAELIINPVVTEISSIASNQENFLLHNEPDIKDSEPENKTNEPEMSVMESTDSNKESSHEVEEIKETLVKETESKPEDIEASKEEMDLTGSLEPMDTYGSQESINLIIDETSNTTDNKDDVVVPTNKINEDTNMEVDQEPILTEISQSLTSTDKLTDEPSKVVATEIETKIKETTDQNKDLKIETDKEEENLKTSESLEDKKAIETFTDLTSNKEKENLQTAESLEGKKANETSTDLNAENSFPNKSKNDNDSNKKEISCISDNKTKESLQTSGTAIHKETSEATTKESSIMESNLLNKSKDDDVIPVEQPPVPIIEIDDEDDEYVPPPTSTNSTSKAVAKEESINLMETEEVVKDSVISSDIEMANTAKAQEPSDADRTSLLAIAFEKSLEDTFKTDETKESADDLEDTTVEVFYSKECINYECQHKHKQYFKVPQFAFSYYKVAKKKFKMQYICSDCYDKALEMYEEFCGLIKAKQPLLMENIPTGRQEFVEIIDSSDDEDMTKKIKPTESATSAFSKNDLNLIERELHNTIKTVLQKVQIQKQLTWSKTILMERLKRLEVETDYVDIELKSLQKKADKMHEGLYTCPKIKIRQLQPLDLNSGKVMALDSHAQKEIQPIPPVGEIERPGIKLNSMYYAVKNNAIASWVPCKVIEQVEGGVTAQKNVKHYKIKFIKNQIQMPKTVPAKYLAYYDPPLVRLPIGTRVIAYFDATSLARGREKINVQSAFYPGIIAEPLKPNNKFRYLIFYDDGYTQYVYHKDVRLVCHVSDSVWEDVHPASRDFIQKYLTQYSINRPMVQTQKGQSMNTESNGYWLHARVVDIDCSLVLMQFEGSKSHTEWIYRGSLRLGPVFKEYQKTLQKNSTMPPISRLPRRTEPFIRYTEDEESSSQQQAEKTNESTRAVARKTFGRPDSMLNSAQPSQQQAQTNLPAVKHLNNSTIYVEDENKPKGKVVYYTAKRNMPPRKYKQHKCSPSCLFEITHNLSAYSPLSKPLLSGWERFIIRQKIKKVVTYRAPCGKIMRHMRELHHYLRVTKNVLNVDNFDFSHETNCLAEYVIESAIVQKRDISNGQEKMAIPLVNYYDNTLPPECKYSAKVIPTEGVHINTDPEFCIGCDCDDDCADKNKCACWQLTLTGAKYGNPNAAPEEVGYQYRRLLDHVPTGIYECNSNCKCKSSCLNRVVQNSLTMKLQVFKTSNRGWGLRCINDIPRGSFVCVYAGHLLTEAKANEGGQDAGDEYFAELDYIEVAEQIKEGYESEVEPPEPEDEEPYNPEGEDDEFTPSRSFLTRSKQKLNAAKSTRNPEEDSQERQVINFNPNADMNEDSVRENSIRKLYGNDEACYVMDAKISGNLGRYFNHSCAPNMFVQNVFVDTHDLRFPHVAFFSSCNIRAGTELTWNYNYEVGVVPGKVLYCQCGAANCRLRLL